VRKDGWGFPDRVNGPGTPANARSGRRAAGKGTVMAEPTGGGPTAPERAGWPAWAEDWVSLLVLVHLTALVVGAFAAPPMSMLEGVLARFFRPYYGLVDMGYSYHFFAPEPPPTA